PEDQEAVGILRRDLTPPSEQAPTPAVHAKPAQKPARNGQASPTQKLTFVVNADSPACSECGAITVRNGACYKCMNCGATTGCSCPETGRPRPGSGASPVGLAPLERPLKLTAPGAPPANRLRRTRIGDDRATGWFCPARTRWLPAQPGNHPRSLGVAGRPDTAAPIQPPRLPPQRRQPAARLEPTLTPQSPCPTP